MEKLSTAVFFTFSLQLVFAHYFHLSHYFVDLKKLFLYLCTQVALTLHSGPYGEVSRTVVLRVFCCAFWFGDACFLQELSSHDACVAPGRLEDTDHVVGQEIGEDKATALVLRILGVLHKSSETSRTELCLIIIIKNDTTA